MKNNLCQKISEKFKSTFDSGFFERIEIKENEIEFFGFRGEVGEELIADAWAKNFSEEFKLKTSINY